MCNVMIKMFSRVVLFVLVSVLKCSTVSVEMSYGTLEDHVRLATDVKEFYRASSVFNVYNDKHTDNSKILMTMFRLSLAFSRYGVLSQSMKLSKLQSYEKYYKFRTGMPLYIVTLRSRLDLEEFTKFARGFRMTVNIWLVFFYRAPELLEYCQRPTSNRLNVAFDTKILIKCEGDPMVREWYSLKPGEVKVNDVARWTRAEGFVRVNRRSIWARRKTLDGIEIRIATVKETPIAVSDLERKEGTLYGLFGSALRELAGSMNFTVVVAATERMYGHYYPEYGNWSGVIGRLVNHEVDIGVGEFGRSSHRLDAVDLAVPLLLAPMNLFFKLPNMTAINWLTYVKMRMETIKKKVLEKERNYKRINKLHIYKCNFLITVLVFDKRLWAINAFFSLVCGTIVATIMTKFKRKPSLSDTAENCFYIWGMQCQQGLPEFPSAWTLKLAFLSVFVSSMLTYISYSATLTSYLTLFTPSMPFNNEKEFLEDTSYKVTVLRGSLYYDVIMLSNDTLAKKMRERMKEDLPIDMFEAYQQVCTEKVVLYTNAVFVNKFGSQIPCKFTSVYTGRLESASYALTKESPFMGILNYYIEKFRVHGILHVLQNRHLQKLESRSSPYLPVSIWNVTSILTLYLNGVLLSLFLLVCERIFHRYMENRTKSHIQRRRIQLT